MNERKTKPAAAPDMYAALGACKEALRSAAGPDEKRNATARARAALAKAGGA